MENRITRVEDYVSRDSLGIKVARLEERLLASDRAIAIAKTEIDRRLADMNELRAQIMEERGHFMLRSEYEGKHEILSNAIRDLQKYQYMALGGLAAFQILVAFLMRFAGH